MEGYPKAAEKFSKEANLQPQQENSAIAARQRIQTSIHMGDIQSAIDYLNELDSEVRGGTAKFPRMLSPQAMIRIRVVHAPRI